MFDPGTIKAATIDRAQLARARKQSQKIVAVDGSMRMVSYYDPEDQVLVVSHVLAGVEGGKPQD